MKSEMALLSFPVSFLNVAHAYFPQEMHFLFQREFKHVNVFTMSALLIQLKLKRMLYEFVQSYVFSEYNLALYL